MTNNRGNLQKMIMLGLTGLAMGFQPLRADAVVDIYQPGGAKIDLPSSLIPAKKDGLVFSGSASGDTMSSVVLTLPIARCVTSHPPGDTFPIQQGGAAQTAQTYQQRAISDGVLTPDCLITLFVFIERLPGSPNGTVTLQSLNFSSELVTSQQALPFILNGQNGGLLTTPLVTGVRAAAGDQGNWNTIKFHMDSLKVSFGSPLYTPDSHVDDLFQLSENPSTSGNLAPVPGVNQVSLRFKSTTATGQMHYRIHVYGMIEFGAMAPILFIHGTNASHTTWEEPTNAAAATSTLVGDSSQARTLDNTAMVSPTCSSCGINGKYAGPWFYKIDLGPAKLTNYDVANHLRAGLDRYANLPVSKDDLVNDGHGNAGNKFSAEQLKVLIPLVLQVYGMGEDTWAHAMCHLVAHSKGGSDCRYLVTKELQRYNAIYSNKHFNVLGLFSLDTPFRGTPVSDLSCAITNSKLSLGMFNGGASPEVVQSISSATTAVSLAVSFGSTPHGAALKDRSYNVDGNSSGNDGRNVELKYWSYFNNNNGQYFSLAGDADIDGDGQIGGQEAKILSPMPVWMNGAGLTSVYRMMATVSGNLKMGREYIQTRNGEAPVMVVQGGTAFGTWMPNDLVAPYLSCLPLELEGQNPKRVTPPFRVTFRHSFLDDFAVKRQLRGGNLPGVDPGNHSMAKNPAVIDGIIGYLKQFYAPAY